jgi:exopolysaccharide biosynthesis protein
MTIISNNSSIKAYTYEVLKQNKHKIHVVTLKEKEYSATIVKAKENQLFGRETLANIASRTKGAAIAINGGFFSIGSNKDGLPSGTLIINNNIHGLHFPKHACITIHDGKIEIQHAQNSLNLKIGDQIIPINSVNSMPQKNKITLYNTCWGKNTGTPFSTKRELVINNENHIVAFNDHGNSAIPSKGFVISFPKEHAIDASPLIGKTCTLDLSQTLIKEQKNFSAMMGIPWILKDGGINPEILNRTGGFYSKPHARTAVGLKSNGDIILIVAEHLYTKELSSFPLQELQNLLNDYQANDKKKITLAQVKDFIFKKASVAGDIVGMTLKELADLFITLGCKDAINLDGGGSSTLWVNGKVVNQAFGDVDESFGKLTERPISDAIVFKLAKSR